MQFAFDRIDHSKPRPVVEPGPTVAWGRSLAGVCAGCHGPGFSGGRIPGGRSVVGPGAQLSTAMPWQALAGMSDEDAHALRAFLQTLSPRSAGQR